MRQVAILGIGQTKVDEHWDLSLRELGGNLERLEAQAEVAQRYRSLQQEGELKQHLLWMLREENAREDRQLKAVAIEQAQAELESAMASMRTGEAAHADDRDADGRLHTIFSLGRSCPSMRPTGRPRRSTTMRSSIL